MNQEVPNSKEQRIRAIQHQRRRARLMDLRFIIAVLFAIFGIIVTYSGIVATPAQIEKAAGVNISLWTGLALLVLSAGFGFWVAFAPPDSPTSAMDIDPEEAEDYDADGPAA